MHAGSDGSKMARNESMGQGLLPLFAADVRAKMEPEEILRSAIEVCPFGIVIVDPLGKIVLANSELERMFGYAHDALIGETVDILVPANVCAQHAQHRTQFAGHPQIRMAKSRNLLGQRKDGAQFPVEIGLNPIHSNEGIFTLGAVIDISERLRSERMKDEFVATVSHELRTPLTSIAGALGLLVKDVAETLSERTARLLTIAHANSQRLVRLVNTILEMEKIESGKVVFVLKRVEVRSLVEQTIEANRGFADGYGVRLRLDAASTACDIRGDPDWLVQVVTNLLSNAIKFTPSGEEVLLAIDKQSGAVRISVRDHGCGVPEHFKGRIFEKFAQADASDARQRGGTGLGLSIVKEIVTRLGGHVGFDDAPGGGAIFFVEVPRWEQEIATASEFEATPNVPASPFEGEPHVLR
jgi:PAS domain S-box-containing protein